MKRNKKAERQKELLRLEEELWSNWKAQRNLGYKPLHKPIPHGYDAVWTLRADVARRKDADRFQYILDNFGKSVWCRKKSFVAYNYFYKKEMDVKPGFKEINPREYEKLPVWAKKFFDERERQYRWGGMTYKFYAVNIPPYYLVMKKSRSYKTHYKVIDEVLKQEAAEIEGRLDSEFYHDRRKRWGGSRSNRTWKKIHNRSKRSYNKQTVRRNIMSAEDGEHYEDAYELKNKGNRCWW